MKEDADTRTTIIVTKLPGSALFIYLCLYLLGQDIGRMEELMFSL